jgi:hypothetical protein
MLQADVEADHVAHADAWLLGSVEHDGVALRLGGDEPVLGFGPLVEVEAPVLRLGEEAPLLGDRLERDQRARPGVSLTRH